MKYVSTFAEYVNGLQIWSEGVRNHHTFLTPKSSKLCFAAASIDAFVPKPLTDPGDLV